MWHRVLKHSQLYIRLKAKREQTTDRFSSLSLVKKKKNDGVFGCSYIYVSILLRKRSEDGQQKSERKNLTRSHNVNSSLLRLTVFYMKRRTSIGKESKANTRDAYLLITAH